MLETETITISKREYEFLIQDSLLLDACKSLGLYDWAWYDTAVDITNEELK